MKLVKKNSNTSKSANSEAFVIVSAKRRDEDEFADDESEGTESSIVVDDDKIWLSRKLIEDTRKLAEEVKQLKQKIEQYEFLFNELKTKINWFVPHSTDNNGW